MYILRRGSIVSSTYILERRLAMPLFCGRKATSLTSFLFLYTIINSHSSEALVGTRKLLFATEEINRATNNEEKELFYEYSLSYYNRQFGWCFRVDLPYVIYVM